MSSSAVVARLLQGSTCCAFRDALLHDSIVMSGYDGHVVVLARLIFSFF